MHMQVDQPRHHHAAVDVDDLRTLQRHGVGRGRDAPDAPALDVDVPVGNALATRHVEHIGVAQDQLGHGVGSRGVVIHGLRWVALA